MQNKANPNLKPSTNLAREIVSINENLSDLKEQSEEINQQLNQIVFFTRGTKAAVIILIILQIIGFLFPLIVARSMLN